MKEKPIILYAEDDPDDREMLRDVIHEFGDEYEVVEATNGREVLEYLKSEQGIQNPPTLIILDLNMPILNGKETLAILKSEHSTELIPIFVFTTSSSPNDREFCDRFSVEMVTKPSSMQEFANVVSKIRHYCSVAKGIS